MRQGTKTFLAALLSFAAGVATTIWLERTYAGGGFLKDTVDSAFREPYTPTKYLIWATFALVFLAVPFGIREMVAQRKFVKQERAMRAARPDDAVTEYVGPEGRGYLFDGPGGRTLLLEPAAGLGAVRTVELPPLPPLPPDADAPPSAPPPPSAPEA